MGTSVMESVLLFVYSFLTPTPTLVAVKGSWAFPPCHHTVIGDLLLCSFKLRRFDLSRMEQITVLAQNWTFLVNKLLLRPPSFREVSIIIVCQHDDSDRVNLLNPRCQFVQTIFAVCVNGKSSYFYFTHCLYCFGIS